MKSYKHKDSRPHIPSTEEGGYETANPLVKDGKAGGLLFGWENKKTQVEETESGKWFQHVPF
ncbi:MAG: hypothetical protein R2830_11470 [Saprospiraceae bacterium]